MVLAILLSGCQYKKYYYKEGDKEEEIQARSDSDAYLKAFTRFQISLKVYDDMKKSLGSAYLTKPTSFELFNNKHEAITYKIFFDKKDSLEKDIVTRIRSGRNVFERNQTTETAIQVNDSATLEQEKIAFGKLRFGMLEKEYDKLPAKEKESHRKIGNDYYEISPYFDDSSRLYMVEITSTKKSANYLDTDVEESAENLHDVIAAKYGTGEYKASFPSIIDFSPGYINTMYKWEIGNKLITVGAGEVSSGAEYYSFCRIQDQKMYNAQQALNVKRKENAKTNDASNF
jgi:hypothetical protein